jgi:hypothetical protein
MDLEIRARLSEASISLLRQMLGSNMDAWGEAEVAFSIGAVRTRARVASLLLTHQGGVQLELEVAEAHTPPTRRCLCTIVPR